MSRPRWEQNLQRLNNELDGYAAAAGVPTAPSPIEAQRLSERVSLAHATSEKSFVAILRANRLLSPNLLAAAQGRAIQPDSAEAILSTGDYVFFYAASFRYPNTSCGFLFAASLEKEHQSEGVAAPFDSGGLVRVFGLPNPGELPRDFLLRHEVPLPEHRDYLRRSLTSLFAQPLDYLDGVEPLRPGPIGLTGGDERRWTHEVRIPKEVHIRTGRLQAAFFRRGLAGANAAVEALVRWCVQNDVDFVEFDSPRGDDFAALQRESIAYLRRHVLS